MSASDGQSSNAGKSQKVVILMLALVGAAVVAVIWRESARSPDTSQPSQTGQPTMGMERSGTVGPHRYWYRSSGPETVAAMFDPRLPRNDRVMVEAVTAVVQAGFAENLAGVWPVPVDRTLVFDGPQHRFVVVLIKEDTGEINGMRIDRQGKP